MLLTNLIDTGHALTVTSPTLLIINIILPQIMHTLVLRRQRLDLFNRIRTIEGLGNLLESSSASLKEEEVHDDDLDEEPALEEEVELPAAGFDAEWDCVLGEEETEVGADVLEQEAVGADLEGEDFEWVGDVEGDPVNVRLAIHPPMTIDDGAYQAKL